MKDLVGRSAFRRDLKRLAKRGINRAPLDAVIEALRTDEPLPAARRDHPLKGDWVGWRDCHIAPDWLLIYKVTATEVLLARTGTHADIFGT